MEPDALVARARTLLEIGRPAEAEAEARAAVGSDPANPAAHLVLSRAYSKQKRHAEAIGAAQAAVALAPELAEAHLALVGALLGDGPSDDAVRAALVAVRLAPHDWATHHALGWALFELGSPWEKEARDAAERANALAPSVPGTYGLLGLTLAACGRAREGRKVVREGLRIDPDDAHLHNNLAAIDLNHGVRLGRAARHLRTAAQVAPQDEVIHHNLDALVVRFATSLAWPTLLALVVLRVQVDDVVAWSARATTGAALVGALVLMTAWFGRQVPRGHTPWRSGSSGRMLLAATVTAGLVLYLALLAMVTAFGPPGWAGASAEHIGTAVRYGLGALLIGGLVRRTPPRGRR
ncbi:tetratricopeptide repeat protein [Nocardioides zeicaulis]|uniref:Tetratricopeptide repeat protein n=1 Tax=Nocardioides zeicaulis TaxID=1776857 RepID=A0ABV6DXI8_9ACTN